MSNSLLKRENVVPFPFGQTLPEESDGPKWQQDWGLIGSNPGVRILSMDLRKKNYDEEKVKGRVLPLQVFL